MRFLLLWFFRKHTPATSTVTAPAAETIPITVGEKELCDAEVGADLESVGRSVELAGVSVFIVSNPVGTSAGDTLG